VAAGRAGGVFVTTAAGGVSLAGAGAGTGDATAAACFVVFSTLFAVSPTVPVAGADLTGAVFPVGDAVCADVCAGDAGAGCFAALSGHFPGGDAVPAETVPGAGGP